MASNAQIRELVTIVKVNANRPVKVLGAAVSWLRNTGDERECGLADVVDEAVKKYVATISKT